MSRARQVRWTCPNGCTSVLGPSRPRRNATCRYCLACSAKSARLVERTAPVVEKRRVELRQKQVVAVVKRRARHAERIADYYTVDGVNLYESMVLFSKLPVFNGHFGGTSMPELRIRRCSEQPQTRFGFCQFRPQKTLISVSVWSGRPVVHFLETLLHELVHAFMGPGVGHGPAFKTALRLASEQAFGVRPRLDNRFHGEITKRIQERETDAAAVVVFLRTVVEQASSQSEAES